MYASFCSVEAAPIVVLYDLFVSPLARKTGAGRALLLAARNHAQANGYARMDLTTAKTNAPAQALYRSLGWIKDDVFDAYNLPLKP
jgi:ribosomal protein S18 acetylase RimI-like enzyme